MALQVIDNNNEQQISDKKHVDQKEYEKKEEGHKEATTNNIEDERRDGDDQENDAKDGEADLKSDPVLGTTDEQDEKSSEAQSSEPQHKKQKTDGEK